MTDKRSAVYKRIKSYLGDKYQPSDDELILLYCDAHAYLQLILKELHGLDSLTFEYTNKAKATNLAKHPLMSEVAKTIQVLNNLLKSLGLTAHQRKKAVSAKDEDDGLDDL